MLDKSCLAKEEIVNPEGLSFLQRCFPSISESDLQEVLNRCEGDLQWATNILLDSSLEYNRPTSSTKANKDDSVDNNQTVDQALSGEDNIYSPPPLAVLCHNSIPADTELSSNKVQQTFYHGSVRRLKSIEEFKRQHSTPSESLDTGLEANAGDRQQNLSIVNPCSPGGTLKDEVFETLFRYKSIKPFASPPQKGKTTLDRSPEETQSPEDEKPSNCPAGRDDVDGESVEPRASPASPAITVPLDEVIEEELKEVTTDLDVSLELPHALAKQLIKMFGPVAFHISPGIFPC